MKATDGLDVKLGALDTVVCPECGQHLDWDYDAWESVCEYPYIAIGAYCCGKDYSLKVASVAIVVDESGDEGE